MSFLISLLLKLATSKAAETLIAVGVKKLLDSKDSGISSDLANTMVNGIAASKQNPTTEDVFTDALKSLSGK